MLGLKLNHVSKRGYWWCPLHYWQCSDVCCWMARSIYIYLLSLLIAFTLLLLFGANPLCLGNLIPLLLLPRLQYYGRAMPIQWLPWPWFLNCQVIISLLPPGMILPAMTSSVLAGPVLAFIDKIFQLHAPPQKHSSMNSHVPTKW